MFRASEKEYFMHILFPETRQVLFFPPKGYIEIKEYLRIHPISSIPLNE